MTLQVRRVVTGHDARGRAVIAIDETTKNVVSSRPGIIGERGLDDRRIPGRQFGRG